MSVPVCSSLLSNMDIGTLDNPLCFGLLGFLESEAMFVVRTIEITEVGKMDVERSDRGFNVDCVCSGAENVTL